jgi:hypothetical protein
MTNPDQAWATRMSVRLSRKRARVAARFVTVQEASSLRELAELAERAPSRALRKFLGHLAEALRWELVIYAVARGEPWDDAFRLGDAVVGSTKAERLKKARSGALDDIVLVLDDMALGVRGLK